MKICAVLLFTFVAAKISIYSPEGLKDKFGSNEQLTTSYANFGVIPYGRSIKGRIYHDSKNPLGCDPFGDFDYHDEDGRFWNQDINPIIIVKRGQCSFVTKVRNIEHAGGKAAIVVDDKFEDVQYVIMSDDGTGGGIRIPSMLVGKSDGQGMIDWLESLGGTKTKKHVPAPGDIDFSGDIEPEDDEYGD